MKKGASHVDWAISMGLFMVFVMLALIFLKPGTEPVYEGDTLLKIVRTQLENSSQYIVEKQLLSISSTTTFKSPPYKFRIRKASKHGLNPDWVGGPVRRSRTAIINDTQTKYNQKSIIFDVYNEYCEVKPNECVFGDKRYYNIPKFNMYVLDIKAPLTTGENTFHILNSNLFVYDTYEEEGVNIDMKDTPTSPDDWCSNCVLDTYNFTYKFGVAEKLMGLSEEKLYYLSNKTTGYNYTALKDSWKLPEDKNFRIRVTNLTAYEYYSTKQELKDYYKNGVNFFTGISETEQIPPQTNVFTEEWKSVMLTPEGEMVPVRVNVEIW